MMTRRSRRSRRRAASSSCPAALALKAGVDRVPAMTPCSAASSPCSVRHLRSGSCTCGVSAGPGVQQKSAARQVASDWACATLDTAAQRQAGSRAGHVLGNQGCVLSGLEALILRQLKAQAFVSQQHCVCQRTLNRCGKRRSSMVPSAGPRSVAVHSTVIRATAACSSGSCTMPVQHDGRATSVYTPHQMGSQCSTACHVGCCLQAKNLCSRSGHQPQILMWAMLAAQVNVTRITQ